MGRGDSLVLTHLRETGGVITRREALALGMPATTLKRWVRRGQLVAIARGTYAQPTALADELSLLRLVTRSLDAIVSHESAARLHHIDGMAHYRSSVSVPIRRSNRFAGVTVHQITDLTADQATTVKGLPVTTATRTIVDLAAVTTAPLLAQTLDQAVRMNKATYEDTAALLEKLARKGKPGVTKLRGILEPRLGGNFVSDSALETRLLKVLADGGLPAPTSQFQPEWLRRMNGRVDLAYPEEKVVVEGDSQKWHGTPDLFQADRNRDNLAQLAGWMVLRFTWKDITTRPDYVVQTVAKALSTRSRGRIRPLEH